MKVKEMKSRRFKVEAQDDEGGAALLGFEDPDNTQSSNINDWGEGEQQQSPQQQSRWTPESTRLMLQLRFERQHEFQQRLRQKKELWSEIAAEMRRQGQADFTINAEVCDLKYRNMLQTYKKNRLKEDSGLQSFIVWEYYDIFKDALKAAEEAEAQEGQERVVPSLLCESVCEAGNEDGDEGSAFGGVGSLEKMCADRKRNGDLVLKSNNMDEENCSGTDELVKPSTTCGSRKRTRTSTRYAAMKAEIPEPLKAHQATPMAAGASDEVNEEENAITKHAGANLKFAPTEPNAMPLLITNVSSINRPSPSKRTRPSYTSAQDDSINEIPAEAVGSGQSECVVLPAPRTVAPVSAAPTVQQNGAMTIPSWLAPTELREYQVFGESIGLQLANMRESQIRALLQFKIQELLYLAKTGRLLDNVVPRGTH